MKKIENFLCSMLPPVFIALVLAIICWMFGIGGYRVESKIDIMNNNVDLVTYIWHNGDIVASSYITRSLDQFEAAKQQQEIWAKSIINTLNK